jgi:DNA-binding LytR/AlgR family response regulator
MTRPTAIIAEDELPQRKELRALLAELWPELEVVAECEDGLAALNALEQHRPRVAFLDIRMPGVSGLEVARAAGDSCHVIFITAVERTRARLSSGAPVDLTALLDLVQTKLVPGGKPGIKWITASVGNVMKMFSIDEVLFFQAQDKYTRVVTADGEGHIRTPLKELLAVLDPETFWQVHRSVIVRIGAIRSVEKGEDGKLSLAVRGHGDVLPVSSAFQYRFRGM